MAKIVYTSKNSSFLPLTAEYLKLIKEFGYDGDVEDFYWNLSLRTHPALIYAIEQMKNAHTDIVAEAQKLHEDYKVKQQRYHNYCKEHDIPELPEMIWDTGKWDTDEYKNVMNFTPKGEN